MVHGDQNEGIILQGGSIQADQIAVGRNAQAIKTIDAASDSLAQKGLQEIQEKLQQLVKALEQNGNALDNQSEILDSTAVVAEELKKDKPNKLTLNAMLEGIAQGVKSVSTIATAVEALKQVITIVL